MEQSDFSHRYLVGGTTIVDAFIGFEILGSIGCRKTDPRTKVGDLAVRQRRRQAEPTCRAIEPRVPRQSATQARSRL